MKPVRTLLIGLLLALLPVIPARAQSPASLPLGTLNQAYTIPISPNIAALGLQVDGLTGSGATLTLEYTNNYGTFNSGTGTVDWNSINGDGTKFCDIGTTMTATGPTVCQASGHAAIRLRVSAAGTGTATIYWNGSSGPTGGGSGGTSSTVAQGAAGSSAWPVTTSPYQYTPLTAPSTAQTVTTTSAGLPSIPTGAQEAYLYNSGATPVVYRWDGVALTSANGIGFPAQSTLVLQGASLIAGFQMLTASGSTTVTVQYAK